MTQDDITLAAPLTEEDKRGARRDTWTDSLKAALFPKSDRFIWPQSMIRRAVVTRAAFLWAVIVISLIGGVNSLFAIAGTLGGSANTTVEIAPPPRVASLDEPVVISIAHEKNTEEETPGEDAPAEPEEEYLAELTLEDAPEPTPPPEIIVKATAAMGSDTVALIDVRGAERGILARRGTKFFDCEVTAVSERGISFRWGGRIFSVEMDD